MKTEPKLTDWEVGNAILCKIIDEMDVLAFEIKESHPEVFQKLKEQVEQLLPIYRNLTGKQALR